MTQAPDFDPMIIVAARVMLAAVFTGALFGKLRHWQELPGVIANYRLLPAWLASPFAVALVSVETAILLLLALGSTAAWGAALAFGSLLTFAVGMAINLVRGRGEIDCGCFSGGLAHQISWALVARNLILALLCAIAGQGLRPNSAAFQVMNGLAAGVALGILYFVYGALLSLRPQAEAFRKRYSR